MFRFILRKQGVGRVAGPVGNAYRAAGALALLCLCTAVPARAQVSDTLIPVVNRADVRYQSSNFVPDSTWDESLVWLRLRIRNPDLKLTQTADRSVVTMGDTIGYTFVAENTGTGASQSVVLADTLPASVRLLSGTVRRDGTALAEGGYTLTSLTDGRQVLSVPLGVLAADARSTVAFRTLVVADSSVKKIPNRGWLADGEAPVVSNLVAVNVDFPDISLEIRILDRSVIYVGDSVVFELKYKNISDVRAENAELTNFLPPELYFLAASPAPSRTSRDPGTGLGDAVGAGANPGNPPAPSAPGGASTDSDWVSWQLGTLQPGQDGLAYIHARLIRLPDSGGNTLENHATLSIGVAGYSVVVAAMLAPVTTQDPTGGSLALSKKAGLLEVGLGEAVPYTLEVENTGPIPLHDLVVWDWLPAGLALVTKGVQGADSVRSTGGETQFYLPGPLAPGAKHLVRYTAVTVSSPGEALVNRAVAEAAFGRVVSDTAVAWVRVRRGPALPSRTLIGKVWVDENDNGRQEPGEVGLGGVDIWTTDGQIIRTDRDGRFSLQDQEPGLYTLRLDMLGLDERYEVATRGGAVQDVRLDGWTMGRAEFRLVPKRVAVDYHAGPPPEVLGLALKAADADPVRSTVVRIPAARDSAERVAERGRALITGPGIEFFSPADGGVVAGGKTFIGVRGEAGRPVALLRGDSLVQEGTLRPDGVFDFIAIPLEPGRNLFRVRTVNSWGQERWDSIAVHRSGVPMAFEVAKGPRSLRAESPEIDTLHVRVLDEWGVPVVTEPMVTIDGHGVTVEAADADRSSVGVQIRADKAGWIRVPVRGRERVGQASLVFAAGRANSELALEVVTPVRPLFATMAGRIGIGGAEEGSFASITARGALDEATSLTLNYDTRRGDREGAAFGRGYDPLGESIHPVIGDGSQRRVISGSTEAFSARIERGLDWAAFGDVRTEGFSGRGKLTAYDRALTGVSTRIGTGPVVWHGFGSATRQLFEEVQLRGDGTSGPYRLGGQIRPGTDRLAIELRAIDNAARVLARTELQRYVDYQIDYRTGEVMLNRLLPAGDVQGNGYFLVAAVERLDSDERHWTGGVRMEVDAASALHLAQVDSLAVSIFGVHDGGTALPGGAGLTGSSLLGGEVNARFGETRVGLELLQASADSTGLAGRAAVEWSPWKDRARLRGEWMSIGNGFSSRQQTRLRSGLEELRLGGDLRLHESLQLKLDHDRQSFREYGVERQSSHARLEHTRGERAYSVEGGLVQETREGESTMNSLLTRINARISSAFTIWAENRQALSTGASAAGRDQIGVGASLRLLERLRLEGQHRRIDAEIPYSVSSLTLNVDPWKGGQLRGGLESATGINADRGLSLGWNQQLTLPAGWSLASQLERRMGLGDLDISDPLRALPFPQVERDRFSAGLGVQWRGQAGERTLSARGEFYDGDLRSGYRFEAQGDAKLSQDFALIARHDWLLSEQLYGQTMESDRRDHSLLGLAFRPTASNTLNALAKVEWRRTVRPDGGTNPALAGDNARLIGSADLVWNPVPAAWMAFRYAIRGSSYSNQVFGEQVIQSRSHFLGTNLEHHLYGRFNGRLDSRLLHVSTTGSSRWSLAPTFVVDLSHFEVEAGYRFGNLQDIDFAGRGGLGFFGSLGVRLTEASVTSAAGFWRERLGR